MRLQKFLSHAGVASRREAERLMIEGRVRVNGKPALELGLRVNPEKDRIELDGKLIRTVGPRWIMLHKPRGVITTRSDPRGRRTVYGLLDAGDQGLRHVGRLDRNTEGLLLLTNDGDLHHALLHPSRGVARRYRAAVEGVPDHWTIARLESGVTLEDGVAKAEAVRLERVLEGEIGVIGLTMREGKKREVRRLLEAVGHPVQRLRRVAFGPIELGRLPPGGVRVLTGQEVQLLRKAVKKT